MAFSSTQTSGGGAPPELTDPSAARIEVTQQVSSIDGTPIVYICQAVKLADAGQPFQPRCSEMMHWDDIKTARNVNDGAPTLMQYFATPGGCEAPPMPWTDGTNRTLYASMAIDPCLSGSSNQPFCTEMLHWDDMCESKTGASPSQQPNSPKPVLMRNLFRPVQGKQQWFLLNGELIGETSISRVSSSGTPLCSEMLHWNDLQTAPTQAAKTA